MTQRLQGGFIPWSSSKSFSWQNAGGDNNNRKQLSVTKQTKPHGKQNRTVTASDWQTDWQRWLQGSA